MDDRGEGSGRRFAILRHELPQNASRPSHWDLMLEHRGVLITWELPTLAFDKLPATFEQLQIRRLADHRIAYLTYEGPVSNDRGTVTQVDCGTYWVSERDSNAWLEVEATGRTYHIRMQLPKDYLSNIKQDRKETEHHLTNSNELLSSGAQLLEFALRATGIDRLSTNRG